jgi:hypothetical protein
MNKLRFFIASALILSMGLFGVVSFNGSESGYNGEGNEGNKSDNTQLKTLVILGAGHFLKSHADFQLFLNKIELSELTGPNYDEWQGILNSAITGMENAAATYRELKTLAAVTPYNPEVIDKLKSFDYPGFMENKNLNQEIFKQVENLLGQGNVTGVYEKIFMDTGVILEGLYRVKQEIDQRIFPVIPNLWELTRLYANSLFFGQYTAVVFKEIK